MTFDRRPSHRCAGFTLVELLLSVAVIAILIAIAVPAFSGIRNVARRTAVTSQITALDGGIRKYQLEQRDFPGIFSHGDVTGRSGILKGIASTENTWKNMSDTESLLLSLLGGIVPDPVATGAAINNREIDLSQPITSSRFYDRKRIGEGPLSGTASAKVLTPYQPYVPVQDFNLTDVDGNNVPEFMDKAQGMPIVYFRANAGASGLITDQTGALQGTKRHNYRYGCKYFIQASYSSDEVVFTPGPSGFDDTDAGKVNFANFITNRQTLQNQTAIDRFKPEQTGWGSWSQARDAVGASPIKTDFMLISAGPDGIFGPPVKTTLTVSKISELDQVDDITNWGR